MNWMTFKDGTKIEIEEGASLGHITHIAQNEAMALYVCEKCTPDNVSEIKFSQPGEDGAEIITGEYSGLLLSGAPTRQTEEDGIAVTVVISLMRRPPWNCALLRWKNPRAYRMKLLTIWAALCPI